MSDNERPGQGEEYDGNTIEGSLVELDDFISGQVADMMTYHPGVTHPALVSLETDELIQRVRIKLWRALKDRPIVRHRAYVRCIVKSEFYDMLRRRSKQFYQLQGDYEEEPGKGHLLVGIGEGLNDPAEEFEGQADLLSLVDKVALALLKLPRRQQLAMLYVLLREVDDPGLLVRSLRRHKVDIRALCFPSDKCELRLLKASLSAARKNMRKYMGDISFTRAYRSIS